MACKMLMFRNNLAHCSLKYEKESEKQESLTTLNWPLTSTLKDLAVQCRLPHGKINWALLHNEFGQVGIGKWGKNCAHHFKPIKNTKQYKKWVMERRNRANGYRQNLSAIPIPIANIETIIKSDDNVAAIPRQPEVTNTINLDPGIGDVSTETFDSFFNDSRTEDAMMDVSPIKEQVDQGCPILRCHYGDGDVKVKVSPPSKTSDRLLSDSTSVNPLIPAFRGLEWREAQSFVNELSECEDGLSPAQISDLEKDVREFLTDLIEDVCDIHDQKVLSNVVMRLVGETSSHHFLYMPSNLNLDTRELEDAMRKLTLEVSAPGSDAYSTVYTARGRPQATPDCTTEFNISINTMDAMIGGFDVADDSQFTDDTSAQRPKKVTVSVAKVLDELDRYTTDDQFMSGTAPVLSVSCDTLQAKPNQGSRDEEPGFDNLGMEGTNILRISMSSPSIMITSPFKSKSAECVEESTNKAKTPLNHVKDDTEETSATAFNDVHFECVSECNTSLEVIPPVSLDSVEVDSSFSSSISSLVNDLNDIFDYNADTEEDLDAKTSHEDRRLKRGSSTNSKNSSSPDVVHHANSGFLLDKSVNEADLEVIDLGQGESRGGAVSEVTGVLAPVAESSSATSTTSTESSTRSSESSSQESLLNKSACHVS